MTLQVTHGLPVGHDKAKARYRADVQRWHFPRAARSPFLFSTYLFPKITKQEGSGGPGPSRVTLEEGRARLAQALVPPTEARTEGFHFPSWSSSRPFPVAPSSSQLAGGQSSFIQLVASGNLPPPRGTQAVALAQNMGFAAAYTGPCS